MQTIAGLTLLELLEHIARTLYIMQLMFTPEDFITANSVSGAAAVTPLLVHMHRLSAVFLIGLKGAILVVQMKAPSVKPSLWLVQGMCWVHRNSDAGPVLALAICSSSRKAWSVWSTLSERTLPRQEEQEPARHE